MRTVKKTIITTVLLSTLLATVSTVEARLKYYRYNENIPMVEMSLNMMVAMGVLEPIPSRLVHDGNPYSRLSSSRYGSYSRSPYSYSRARYSDRYGFGDYWDEPISPYRRYRSRYDYADPWHRSRGDYWDSPWLDRWGYSGYSGWDSPWTSRWDYPGYSGWDSRWDFPGYSGWDSPWTSRRGYPGYSSWDSPGASRWGYPGYSSWSGPWASRWNNPYFSGWGSPWGSIWSSQLLNPWSNPLGNLGSWPYSSNYSTWPLSPDLLLDDDVFNNIIPEQNNSSRPQQNSQGFSAEKTSWSGRSARANYHRSRYRSHKQRAYRNSTKQNINGLWIGENGEMLGIRGRNFLWYDDENQYTQGQLLRSPTMMKAKAERSNKAVSYHYRLHGNELVIMGRDGRMRTFNRMPIVQPQYASAKPRSPYASYSPKTRYAHVSYSGRGSGRDTPGTLNSRSQSHSASSAAGIDRHNDFTPPRKFFSYEKSIYTGDIPSGPRMASFSEGGYYQVEPRIDDSGNESGKSESTASFDTSLHVPTTTIPMYMQYLPAAGTLNSNHGTDPDEIAIERFDESSSPGNSSLADPDSNDPNTYLYSYLKDNDNTQASITYHAEDSFTQAAATATYVNHTDTASSAVVVKNETQNIWKPNILYPHRRRDAASTSSNYSVLNTGWDEAE